MLFKKDYKIIPENLPDTLDFKTMEPQNNPAFIVGTDNDDNIHGTVNDDHMSGFDGDDTMWGNDGNDIIAGGNGNDTLIGEAGNDELYGGAGNDQLDGGLGDDELTGGSDADTFRFQEQFSGWGNDVITDFEDGVDKIQIMDGFTGVDYSALQITDTDGGALIEYGTSSILINGIAAADLSQDDFII